MSTAKIPPPSRRTFQCPECKKPFSRKEYVERHSRLKHMNSRPFKCEDCESAYARSDLLRRHQRTCARRIARFKDEGLPFPEVVKRGKGGASEANAASSVSKHSSRSGGGAPPQLDAKPSLPSLLNTTTQAKPASTVSDASQATSTTAELNASLPSHSVPQKQSDKPPPLTLVNNSATELHEGFAPRSAESTALLNPAVHSVSMQSTASVAASVSEPGLATSESLSPLFPSADTFFTGIPTELRTGMGGGGGGMGDGVSSDIPSNITGNIPGNTQVTGLPIPDLVSMMGRAGPTVTAPVELSGPLEVMAAPPEAFFSRPPPAEPAFGAPLPEPTRPASHPLPAESSAESAGASLTSSATDATSPDAMDVDVELQYVQHTPHSHTRADLRAAHPPVSMADVANQVSKLALYDSVISADMLVPANEDSVSEYARVVEDGDVYSGDDFSGEGLSEGFERRFSEGSLDRPFSEDSFDRPFSESTYDRRVPESSRSPTLSDTAFSDRSFRTSSRASPSASRTSASPHGSPAHSSPHGSPEAEFEKASTALVRQSQRAAAYWDAHIPPPAEFEVLYGLDKPRFGSPVPRFDAPRTRTFFLAGQRFCLGYVQPWHIPPLQTLSAYAEQAAEIILPVLPLLHRGTARGEMPSHIAFTLCVLGALYTAEGRAFGDRLLMEKRLFLVKLHNNTDDKNDAELVSVLQSMALYQCLGLLHSEAKQRTLSYTLHPIFIEMYRRARIPEKLARYTPCVPLGGDVEYPGGYRGGDSTSDHYPMRGGGANDFSTENPPRHTPAHIPTGKLLQRLWREWIEYESQKRTAFTVKLVDLETDAQFKCACHLRWSEIDIELPAPDNLWDALTAEEWYDNYKHYRSSQERPLFFLQTLDALVAEDAPNLVNLVSQFSSYSLLILLRSLVYLERKANTVPEHVLRDDFLQGLAAHDTFVSTAVFLEQVEFAKTLLSYAPHFNPLFLRDDWHANILPPVSHGEGEQTVFDGEMRAQEA